MKLLLQLGRVRAVPLGVVVAPRYATLPLPHAHPPRRQLQHPPFYYPQHDHNTVNEEALLFGDDCLLGLIFKYTCIARRRQRRGPGATAHSARSLERVHRRRRAAARPDGTAHAQLSDADLRRTYTGLDRAYAEQFITVCDESRSQATDRSLSHGEGAGAGGDGPPIAARAGPTPTDRPTA
ncbi:hypothetical protein EVAR_82527_1 [Eumeta japonica]|uniref:Uncharacterized protein n=1 Tax=Eumeta variegata TaxID=151549 RepID=A0A4C1UWG8_EUMVA|nr:hypothetical protein EVAR_82527_1 [Eumeta japonica]